MWEGGAGRSEREVWEDIWFVLGKDLAAVASATAQEAWAVSRLRDSDQLAPPGRGRREAVLSHSFVFGIFTKKGQLVRTIPHFNHPI